MNTPSKEAIEAYEEIMTTHGNGPLIIQAAIDKATEPLVKALKEFENEYPHVTRLLNNR